MISLASKISHCLSAKHNPELRCVICSSVTLFAPVFRYALKCRLMRWMLFVVSITKCPLSYKVTKTHNSVKYEVLLFNTCNAIQIWSCCSRYLSSVGNRYPAVYVASYVIRESEVKKCRQKDLKMLRALLSIC